VLVVYDKNTHQIIGHCSKIFDSGKWREPTMEELYPNRDRSNLASAYMPDDARFIGYGPHNFRLRKDENGIVVGVERLPGLTISCDAQDSDNDDVPDIPADGKSVARITVTTADKSDTEVTFRTSRGTLQRRTVPTSKGKASVDLRSSTETVSATVTATAKGFRTASLTVEFIPLSPNKTESRD
jgi:hypothetical protein